MSEVCIIFGDTACLVNSASALSLSLSLSLSLTPAPTHSDPPVDACNIPSGEWLCRRCRAGLVDEGVPLLFRPIVEQACVANPLIFDIPYEYQRNEVLPGTLHNITIILQSHTYYIIFACVNMHPYQSP